MLLRIFLFSDPTMECPLTVGREPTSLPRLGDTRASLMLSNQFTCSGHVTAFSYFRGATRGSVYVGIWRQTGDNDFYLRHSVELPAASIDVHTVHLPTPLVVVMGDFLGVHYSRSAPTAVITSAGLLDADVSNPGILPGDLYQTQCVTLYQEDVTSGSAVDISRYSQSNERKTYALQAHVTYDVTTPGNNARQV